MPAQRAAVCVRLDLPHPDKQQTACFRYAERRGLTVTALCFWPEDCVRLVRAGAVDVVIVAIEDAALDVLVAESSGRLDVALPRAAGGDAGPGHRDLAGLIRRMARRRMSVEQIADILQMPVAEVRRTVYLLGTRPRPGRGGHRGGAY